MRICLLSSRLPARRRSLKPIVSCCCTLLLVAGCASRGPGRVATDRGDYGAAIGDSLKVQNLLNIVRLRYLDWPTFLEVDQVAAAYTWNVNAALQGQVRTVFGADNDQVTATIGGSFQERPTILYKPLGGVQFVDSMLTPIRPSVVLALVQSGWSANRLLESTFHAVNGFKNLNAAADTAFRPSPEFTRFVQVMFALQRENALSFRSGPLSPEEQQAGKDRPSMLKFYVDQMSPETRREFELMRGELGLSAETDTYKVIWGLQTPDGETLALQTRSMLGFMAALTLFVEVPPEDLEDGSAPDYEPIPEEPEVETRPLMHIRSGDSPPPDPYVAVRYDGHWFWIDKADSNSKRTFAYLSLLLTVTEGGGRGGTPLVLTVN